LKCNVRLPKLTKEEQQNMASIKSTLPYIDRMQIYKRTWCEVKSEDEKNICSDE
jgi:hypothetical protein